MKAEKSREQVDDDCIRETINRWLKSVRNGNGEKAKVLFHRDTKPNVHIPDLEGVQGWEITDIYARYRPEDLDGNDCDAFGTARVAVVCRDKTLDYQYKGNSYINFFN